MDTSTGGSDTAIWSFTSVSSVGFLITIRGISPVYNIEVDSTHLDTPGRLNEPEDPYQMAPTTPATTPAARPAGTPVVTPVAKRQHGVDDRLRAGAHRLRRLRRGGAALRRRPGEGLPAPTGHGWKGPTDRPKRPARESRYRVHPSSFCGRANHLLHSQSTGGSLRRFHRHDTR